MLIPTAAPMRAAVLDPTPSRGRRGPQIAVREVTAPVPHAPGWVVLQPALSGICHSDIALVRGEARRTGTAAASGVVPGHEVVGVVTEARDTRWVREGQRVILEPTLRCVHKGLPECRRCRAGEGHLCENADRDGLLCSGSGVGFSVRTGGGWSEALLVHEEMLLPAEGISDQRAVLAEPAAIALHGVMRWQRRGDSAMVIGGGTISRLVVATLRRLHHDLDITMVLDTRTRQRERLGQRHRALPGHFQNGGGAEVGAIRAMGASRVWRGTSEEILEKTARLTGGRLIREGDGLPVMDRGVDLVVDCRGTEASINVALRALRAGGTLVLLAEAGRHDVDWSLLFARELSVLGSLGYGREANGWRTFAAVRDWLSDPAFPVDGMVTHRFPLDQITSAVETASAGLAVGAVKVVIEGPAAQLRDRPQVTAPEALPESEDPLYLHAARNRVALPAPADPEAEVVGSRQ